MSIFDSLKRWFRGEADEVRESMDDAAAALNADLDRREAELKASPEEKMDQLLEEIEQSDQQLDELTAEIQSESEAAGEVADAAGETVPVEDEGPEAAI
jgi:phage shock protein A